MREGLRVWWGVCAGGLLSPCTGTPQRGWPPAVNECNVFELQLVPVKVGNRDELLRTAGAVAPLHTVLVQPPGVRLHSSL